MKFIPQKLQDVNSIMALESIKNSKPIERNKFFKITARLPYFFRQECTLFLFYLSFFVYFVFLNDSFFYSFLTF